MKTLTINFNTHIGDGGYGLLFRWTWRVRNRVYLFGIPTPFMVVNWKFK